MISHRLCRVLGLFTLLAFCTTPASAEKVAGWDVDPLRSNQGADDGCMMKGAFENGRTIGVYITRQRTWGLWFHDPSWRLREGQKVNVNATVDGTSIADGQGEVIGTNVVAIPLRGAESYEAIQAGQLLRVSTSVGDIGGFNLRGTRLAMNALINCITRQPDGRQAAQPQQQPRSQPQQQAGNPGTPIPAAELTKFVTTILTQGGVTGFTFDQRKDDIVAWTLPSGVRGVLFAYRNWNKPIETPIADVIDFAAKDCKGDLATVRRAVPTDDGSIVRKVTTACSIGTNTVTQTWTIVHRTSAGQLFTFLHSAGPTGEASQRDAITAADNFLLANILAIR